MTCDSILNNQRSGSQLVMWQQTMIYFPTSPVWCLCTIWQSIEMWKLHLLNAVLMSSLRRSMIVFSIADLWLIWLQCFDTVGWRQEAHPACKNWVMRCWCGYLSGARCRLFACGPADATAIPKPHHLYVFYLFVHKDCTSSNYYAAKGCLRGNCMKYLLP